jgi:hypothetical protein
MASIIKILFESIQTDNTEYVIDFKMVKTKYSEKEVISFFKLLRKFEMLVIEEYNLDMNKYPDEDADYSLETGDSNEYDDSDDSDEYFSQ